MLGISDKYSITWEAALKSIEDISEDVEPIIEYSWDIHNRQNLLNGIFLSEQDEFAYKIDLLRTRIDEFRALDRNDRIKFSDDLKRSAGRIYDPSITPVSLKTLFEQTGIPDLESLKGALREIDIKEISREKGRYPTEDELREIGEKYNQMDYEEVIKSTEPKLYHERMGFAQLLIFKDQIKKRTIEAQRIIDEADIEIQIAREKIARLDETIAEADEKIARAKEKAAYADKMHQESVQLLEHAKELSAEAQRCGFIGMVTDFYQIFNKIDQLPDEELPDEEVQKIFNDYLTEGSLTFELHPEEHGYFSKINSMTSVIKYLDDHPDKKLCDFRPFEDQINDISTFADYLKTPAGMRIKKVAFMSSLPQESKEAMKEVVEHRSTTEFPLIVKYFDE